MTINEIITSTISEYINEVYDDYSQWKRRNVTARGIKNHEISYENGWYGSYGKGLYTVPLSNKAMAKQYGEIYYVINAIPKKPKIVNTVNDAEMLVQNLVFKFCKQHGEKYNTDFFEKNTSIEDEMMKLGYDGLIIKGREMVNYKPENYKYFSNENALFYYYQDFVKGDNLNEATAARDKEFYDIADEFYEKMIVELNNGNYIEQDEKLIIFKASEINLNYKDLLIFFVKTDSTYTNTPFGNKSTKGNYGFGTLKRNKVIIIPNLRNDMNPSYGILKDSFIHEFIHYLDFIRSKGNFPNFTEKSTMSDYYNSPSEYNAYYQEAANYLVNLLKDDKVLSIIRKNHPTFNSFYSWMLNNVFSKRFIANLNDKNKLKIQKRLYNIYSEYIQNNN